MQKCPSGLEVFPTPQHTRGFTNTGIFRAKQLSFTKGGLCNMPAGHRRNGQKLKLPQRNMRDKIPRCPHDETRQGACDGRYLLEICKVCNLVMKMRCDLIRQSGS